MKSESKIRLISISYVKEVLAFPILICVAAMSLITVYALLVIASGHHLQSQNFLINVLAIAGAVAVPMTTIAFLREHRKYTARLKLLDFAFTDPLTGLLNRRSFQDAVADEKLRMARSFTSAAIVLLDLDHFKKLNDTYGHALGDRVLIAVSAVAHSELRSPFDRLARWGGEEFIVLLNDVSSAEADLVAQRLRERIQSELFQVDGIELGVTASFGVTHFTEACSFDEVLSRADAALYLAKSLGRNEVVASKLAELAA